MRLAPRIIIRLAVALAGLALTVTHAAPAQATSEQEAIFQDDTQLRANLAGTMAQLRALGVDRVRVSVHWRSLAPAADSTGRPSPFPAADPAAYPASGWAVYDAIDRAARSAGLSVYFSLTGPVPAWAEGPGAPAGNVLWKPSGAEFRSFVTAVGRRYSGTYRPTGAQALPRVSYWGIWNEPNYGSDLSPQSTQNGALEVAPALYRGLVDGAWSALQATGHGQDTILIGELAPRGQGDGGGIGGGMYPIRFLRGLYCVDRRLRPLSGSYAAARGCPGGRTGQRRFARAHPGLFQATGVADHPFAQAQGPLVSTWPFAGENQYTDFPQIPALERLLDGVQRVYGPHRRFLIYNTEFGEQVPRIDQGTAALYLNWFEYLSWRDPRIVSTDQYLLRDPAGGNFPTGLEDRGGRPLAAYYAYQLPLYLPLSTGRRGRSLELWGDVRPAKYLLNPPPVEIQFAPGHSAAFVTVRKVRSFNRQGYFDVRIAFRSSGHVRLRWSPASGGAITSRSASITVR